MTPSLESCVAQAKAFILDMDGTLVLGNAASGEHEALAGAIEFIDLLRKRDIPFRVFTNGTAKTPAAYAASLRNAGFAIDDGDLMTPATAAAHWFRARGIKRVRALGLDGVQLPLRDAGIEVVGPGESAEGVEAVFTGWFREFAFPDLERACQDVWNGASVSTASNVPFFAARGGRAIGASYAINAMIRAMTGKQAKVLGKPAREALRCALRTMALPVSLEKSTIVVGDDPALEMRMARSAGAVGIAVGTGVTNAERFSRLPLAERPHFTLGALDQLIQALG